MTVTTSFAETPGDRPIAFWIFFFGSNSVWLEGTEPYVALTTFNVHLHTPALRSSNRICKLS